MTAPKLDTPLVLEKAERSTDTGGGVTVAWTALGTVWAEVHPVSARETVSGLRESARISHRITVRGAPLGSPQRPRPDQRFRVGDRVLAIRAVTPADGRNRYLTCWAEEGPFS